MKIASIEVYRYVLPLVEAMRIKDTTLATRVGLIVRLIGDNGASGSGEIAPLPAYSPDTLDEAIAETKALAESVDALSIPDGVERLDGRFEEWIGQRISCPSVRFGFELAVLNLLAAERGVPLRRLISEAAADEVPVAGLLNGNLGEIRRKTEYLEKEGYTAAKLKVGRYDVPTDVQTAQWLCEHFSDNLTIRLDANRAWTFDTAAEFARKVAGRPIDYIEEPVDDPAKLDEFARSAGLSVALDESLQDMTVETFRPEPFMKAVILKPTVLGLEKAVRIGRRAKENGLAAIVSSTYESGFGLCALAELAAAIQAPSDHAGLDTYEWLDADILRTRPPLRRPVLKIADLEPFATSFDEERLEKLTHA